MRALWYAAAVLLIVACASGCEKVDHENIDRWMTTEKGVEKLTRAVRSGEHDAGLRAHAAQNLILHPEGHFPEVKDAFEDMDQGERASVMAALVPLLWEDARVAGELDVPAPTQYQAKDALFDLRGYASEETQRKIDEYLVEWLAGGYYEGRAKSGRVAGREIIRMIGRPAAPRLLEGARRMVVKSGAAGENLKIGDELLVALATTGDPASAEFVLDLALRETKDETLPERAMAALVQAYVKPISGTPVPGRDALLPLVPKLTQIANNENLPGVMNNDAADLIVVIGPPECIPPMVERTAMAAASDDFRWSGAQQGLRCGGAQAMVSILEAMPPTTGYDRGMLQKYLWKEILAAPSAVKVAEQARQLLSSSSWVARVTGIEVLGALALRDSAAEDAKRIRALAKDRTVLKGWWGAQKDAPKGKRKPDPTLGSVAAEVAGRLEGLAKGTETK